jgi:hypothetical protein
MRETLSYGACYVLWAVSAGLGVLDVMILRSLLQRLSLVAGVNPWVFGAITNFGTFLFGLAWIAFAVAVESYYRTGAGEGNLIRRFGRVIVAELTVTAVGAIVPIFVKVA